MKISGSFFMMLLIWALGFTHIFGGPYVLFKVIFWISLLPYFIITFVFILMIWKAKKLLNFSSRFRNQSNNETLEVKAEVKE